MSTCGEGPAVGFLGLYIAQAERVPRQVNNHSSVYISLQAAPIWLSPTSMLARFIYDASLKCALEFGLPMGCLHSLGPIDPWRLRPERTIVLF